MKLPKPIELGPRGRNGGRAANKGLVLTGGFLFHQNIFFTLMRTQARRVWLLTESVSLLIFETGTAVFV